MSDGPIEFTDEQRECFRKISELIRIDPAGFAEAGQWLDAGAALPDAIERIRQVRRENLPDARDRQRIARTKGREAGRAYNVPAEGPTLAVSRIILARRIRKERADAAAEPSPYDILTSACHAIFSDSPNYDALRPDLAEQQAKRVLLVVWILTEPRSLATAPAITKLQSWEWGAHELDFLASAIKPNGDLDLDAQGPVNRLLARTTLLDRDIERWEKLARQALRQWEDARTLELHKQIMLRQQAENDQLRAWLRQDWPDYDERCERAQLDPEFAPAMETLSREPVDQAALGVIYRLHERYGVPSEPKINTPERLMWWLAQHRSKPLEVRGHDYLTKYNRLARDYAGDMRQADPALPALPPRDSDSLGEWQALYDWCVRAKRTMNSLRNSDSGGAEAPAKEAASCIVLSEADLKILKTLDASNVLLKGPDAYVDVTERTGKQALKRMENAGLIARPHGERSGYVITDTGRDRLSGNN